MQEVNIDELELETDLEEDESDPESVSALEKFLKTLNIKKPNEIPALKTISARSKKILHNFCQGKNHKNRIHKVTEFLKCLDWIPFEEMDMSILDKFEEHERKILLKDIKIYLNKKAEKHEQSYSWKQEYKKRIVEYYKIKVPRLLKIELEHLRDYELNTVGHDRNWQHYFKLQSFKKVDELVNLSPQAREELFRRFKKDVMTYKHNRERNVFGDKGEKACNKHWDDDIIKNINWESGQKEYKKPDKQYTKFDASDYTILELPYGADTTSIKKQYRKLAQIYHPDKPTGDEKKMKAIVGAYQRLIKS